MHHLVVGALQESRIDRAERLHPLGRHAGRKGDRMLLGESDVEGPLRESLGEHVEPGAGGHRRRHRDDAIVNLGLGDQRVGENPGVGRRPRRRLHLFAGHHVEFGNAVVLVGAPLGGRVTLALLGHDMQQDRTLVVGVAQVAQHRHQVVHIVPVDRTDIVEAQLFEQRAAAQQATREFVGPLRSALERARKAARHLRHQLADRQERPRRDQARQIGAHGAHRRCNRHVVVVQHHDEIGPAGPRIVHRLIGHPGAHRTVTDDGDHMPALTLQLPRHRHSKPGGDRGRGMRRAEGVVLAFGAAGEAREAAALAQGAHPAAPPGQDLVRISLMTDVPDQPVVRCLEYRVDRNRQLNHAERGAEMAARHGNGVDRLGAQFRSELL